MNHPSSLRLPARRVEFSDGVREHHPSGQALVCPLEHLDRELEAEARALGFVRAGRVGLGPFAGEARELERFLEQGRHGVMTYLAERTSAGRLLREDPRELLPGARSALVVALPYGPSRPAELSWPRRGPNGDPLGSVAKYAGGSDYHLAIKQRLLILADLVADLTGAPQICRACVDTAPLLERQLARDAGLVFLGKHTLGITPGVGSFFLLGVLLLQLPPPSAPPARLGEGCGSCKACAERCPTGALDGRSQIDATRCISYLTIEYRGTVPRELRALMGSWVFGCDICQTVCPYNAAKGVPPGDAALRQAEHWTHAPLLALLTQSSSAYKRRVRGTTLRRVDRSQLVRNAAIALGNVLHLDATLPLAEVARSHPSPAARVHATWALGQFARAGSHPPARQLLLELRSHPDPDVAAEAQLCIAELAPEEIRDLPEGGTSQP